MRKRITIKDVAEEARVSRGTVDRVIHRRGKVAPDVKAKVEKALKTLGYSPNMVARALAKNKIYHIATLLPDPKYDAFWQSPQNGIQKAYEATRDFGIHMEQFFFKMDDPSDFMEKAKQLIHSNPDGILIATEFYREAMLFFNEIKSFDIPIVSINTHLKEMVGASYIGQHSYQSGQLAGKLFDISLHESAQLLILHLGPPADNAMHFMDKEKGVLDYFADLPVDIGIIKEEFERYDEPIEFESFINSLFLRHSNIKGIFVTNSRAYHLIPILEKLGSVHDLCIVGFDLLEENCDLLRKGKIDFLINQDPTRQGNLGILKLVDNLVFGKSNNSINYLPLDIVVPENLDTYYQASRADTASRQIM